MIITKQMVMALEPCYTEEQIDELLAGRSWVKPSAVAKLDIPLADILWILTKLMTQVQQREFAIRCALDVIHLWDAPDVVREYLETENENLRSAAMSAGLSAAWAAAWSAARSAASAAARSAAWSAALSAALDAASAAAWSAARAEAMKKYISWCVEYLEAA